MNKKMYVHEMHHAKLQRISKSTKKNKGYLEGKQPMNIFFQTMQL